MHLIIDGYNVIKRNPELSSKENESLEAAREGLIKLMRVYKGIKPNYDIIIVFDGVRGNGGQSTVDRSMIKVVFANGSADDYIKEMLNDSKTPADYTVISDDNDIINYARSRRAGFLSTTQLFEKIGPQKTKETGYEKPTPHSPDARSITQELIDLWVDKGKRGA